MAAANLPATLPGLCLERDCGKRLGTLNVYSRPAVWFPTVRTNTGTDVFTERLVAGLRAQRSEERRVGKEGRSRWAAEQEKNKKEDERARRRTQPRPDGAAD